MNKELVCMPESGFILMVKSQLFAGLTLQAFQRYSDTSAWPSSWMKYFLEHNKMHHSPCFGV